MEDFANDGSGRGRGDSPRRSTFSTANENGPGHTSPRLLSQRSQPSTAATPQMHLPTRQLSSHQQQQRVSGHPTTLQQRRQQQQQLDFHQAMSDFATMFPAMDSEVIEAVLRANDGAVDPTIDQLLTMNVGNDVDMIQLGEMVALGEKRYGGGTARSQVRRL